MTLSRVKIIFVLATFVGIGAASVVYSVLTSAQSGGNRDIVPVVVANADLGFGTKLEPSQVQIVNFPKGSVPVGAYGHIDSVVGQTTKIFLAGHEAILRTKLSTKGGGLSMRVEPSMRASSVDVKASSSVSGFIVPGDRVDVLVTIDRIAAGVRNEAKTWTLLQSVVVLAAGPKIEQKDKEDKPSDMQTVTLLVDPIGAEKLVLGMHQGKIHLTLRNPEDTEKIEDLAAVTTREIQGGPPAGERKPRAVARRRRTPKTVQAKPQVSSMREPEAYHPSVIRGVTVTAEGPANSR